MVTFHQDRRGHRPSRILHHHRTPRQRFITSRFFLLTRQTIFMFNRRHISTIPVLTVSRTQDGHIGISPILSRIRPNQLNRTSRHYFTHTVRHRRHFTTPPNLANRISSFTTVPLNSRLPHNDLRNGRHTNSISQRRPIRTITNSPNSKHRIGRHNIISRSIRLTSLTSRHNSNNISENLIDSIRYRNMNVQTRLTDNSLHAFRISVDSNRNHTFISVNLNRNTAGTTHQANSRNTFALRAFRNILHSTTSTTKVCYYRPR